MHPYRPLHVTTERFDDDGDELARDDRLFSTLLIAFGLLRVAPALWLDQPLDTEIALAWCMVVTGACSSVAERTGGVRSPPPAG